MKYFFEIPIYSMKEEDYDRRMDEKLQREINRYGLEEDNPNYKLAFYSIHKHVYRTWQYNQIVGYFRLYKFATEIYGKIWMIENKRIPLRLDKKVYKDQLISTEWSIDLNDIKTSNEFYNKLLKELPHDHREYSKGRYLDLRLLKEIGPFVDWLKVLEKYE